MGVAYLLTYIAGALLVVAGSTRLLNDLLSGSDLTEGGSVFLDGVVVILAGGILQAVVIGRRGDAGVLDDLPPAGSRVLILGAIAWLASVTWPWIQFELFWNPIRIYPLITLLASSASVFALAHRIFRQSKLRVSFATMSVALLGVPLGLLSVIVPAAHFNHHLTDVRTSTYSTSGGVRDHTFSGSDAFLSEHESESLGDETARLLDAIGQAEPIDVEADIEQGRLMRLEDGTLVILDEEHFAAMADQQEVAKRLEDALEEDRKKAAQDRARESARALAEMNERRLGGRILGFTPPDTK
jgi:hypothetical protein